MFLGSWLRLFSVALAFYFAIEYSEYSEYTYRQPTNIFEAITTNLIVQIMLAEEIEYTDATPSLSQAQRLRKFSEQGRLSIDTIFAVLSEEKPNQKEQVKFKTEDIRKYFPKSYTNLDMQKTIISLLEKWQRQRERNRGEAR